MIAVDGRSLTKAERNWSVTDRELGAIRWCLRKFRSLLIGFKIRICTDHKAIVDIWKRTDLYPKQIRAVQELMEFDFELNYIKGPHNEAADCASRYNFEVIESSRFDPLEALRERANVGVCSRCRRELEQDSGDVLIGSLSSSSSSSSSRVAHKVAKVQQINDSRGYNVVAHPCLDYGRDIARHQARCVAAVVNSWPEENFVDQEEDEDALEDIVYQAFKEVESEQAKTIEAVISRRLRREEEAAERALVQFDPKQMFVDNLLSQQCEEPELRRIAEHLKKRLPWKYFEGSNAYLGAGREHMRQLRYHKQRSCICYKNRIVLPEV